jgi:hypothetical protein
LGTGLSSEISSDVLALGDGLIGQLFVHRHRD